jgi:hypothetical protein
VNGKPAGNVWKPPYRLDITSLVRNGENDLEIEVANLWPNRLIGDEQLPPEYEYGGGGGMGGGGRTWRKSHGWHKVHSGLLCKGPAQTTRAAQRSPGCVDHA